MRRFETWFGVGLSALLVALVVLSAAGLTARKATAMERRYYIAADEVVWDYAPSYPDDPLSGESFSKAARVFLDRGAKRIGREYLKAVYREYTDASFKTLKPRGPAERHLGLLGPVIHAEVGDTITLVFRNNSRFPVGMHPHGVFYDKASEGAHYQSGPDTAAAMASAHVPPGTEYTYHWRVPERAGPGPNDASSVVWPYHTHDHQGSGIYAGLIGAIIVTRAGEARPDGSPKDVDREFVTLFGIMDENASPYLEANIARFAGEPKQVDAEDEAFKESNLMHAINGRLYGTLDGLEMHKGERVRWYVIGIGNEVDIHTAHWHGNTLIERGHRLDTTQVFPATTAVLDMRPDAVGTWLFHCHVADHMAAGMMTRYTVLP